MLSFGEIRISEEKLRKIVDDAVYRVLMTGRPLPSIAEISPYDERSENIIKGISENDLKSCIIDYRCINDGFSYDDFAGLMLNEGIFATFPIDTTIRHLRRHFKIPEAMIGKSIGSDGNERINVTIATINDNYEVLKRIMHLCGYYRAYPPCNDNDIPKNKWVTFQFEPCKPPADTTLLNGETTLLHITRSERAEKILRQGFVPKSKNSSFRYPERIYFLKGSMKNKWIQVASMLYAAAETAIYSDGKPLRRRYSCITVDIDNIPKNIEFFADANFKGGVYTEEYIPPSAIVSVEKEWITIRKK